MISDFIAFTIMVNMITIPCHLVISLNLVSILISHSVHVKIIKLNNYGKRKN